jgi:hypothetical protein
MKVRLANGRAARARARKHPLRGTCTKPATVLPFSHFMAAVPEGDPESWPPYVIHRDENGVLHIVDVDCPIEWDGWRIPEFDQAKGGAR